MPPRNCLSDTPAAVEARQLDLLRKAGPARRLEIACMLSQQMIERSRAAVRQRHPDLDEQQVRLRCVALWYGEELAERVKAYLEHPAV